MMGRHASGMDASVGKRCDSTHSSGSEFTVGVVPQGAADQTVGGLQATGGAGVGAGCGALRGGRNRRVNKKMPSSEDGICLQRPAYGAGPDDSRLA